MNPGEFSFSSQDVQFMREALQLAREALSQSEVPVACVIVDARDKQVVATGHNLTNATHNATRHAELVAFDKLFYGTAESCSGAESAPCSKKPRSGQDPVGPLAILSECTLYVTVEPCVMCADAIKSLGLKRVVFGCRNDRFGGCGSVLPVLISPLVQGGLLAAEAMSLLKDCYAQENPFAPVDKRAPGRSID